MELYSLLISDTKQVKNIRSVRLTTCANTAKELTPGSVCAAMVEVKGLGAPPQLQKNQRLQLMRGQTSLGFFYLHSLQKQNGQWTLTAYDAVPWLDVDVSEWLQELTGWPYSLTELTQLLLERCGMTMATSLPTNATYSVKQFSAEAITARQILSWICQVSGCYCRDEGDGALGFYWFGSKDIQVRPTGDVFYYADGLQLADYTTAPVEKVQLRLIAGDVGAVYPNDATKTNAVIFTGNYLLGSSKASALSTVAKNLYTKLKGGSHTPCTLRTTAQSGIRAGDIFTVVDTDGASHSVCAMNCVEEDGVLTVTSTGETRRDQQTAVNEAKYRTLSGRVMELQADVEGVRIENRDAQENLAALTLKVEGITAKVSQNKTKGEETTQIVTTLQQSAEELSLQVEQLSKNGSGSVTTSTGYTFNQDGLKIAKKGQEMENLLDNTGMYVRRSGEVILQANAAGVQARDVTAHNYLIIGSHARFEDYPTNRTACFYLE